MSKRHRLWTLGISALLSMGTSYAKISNDSIPATKEIAAAPTTYDKPQVPAHNWYSELNTWLENASLADFVSENLPFVKIDSIDIKNIDDFEKIFGARTRLKLPAQYNPIKNEITIRVISLTRFSVNDTGISIIRHEEAFQIKKFAERYNKTALACLAHELRHYINANSISLYGLSGTDIALLQVYDEISARIEELLLRRNIFMTTKSIQNISTDHQGYYSEDKFKPYYKYLRKNHESISDTMTMAEADMVINCAIKNFMTRDTYAAYQKSIPQVIYYKLQMVTQKYIKTENKSDLQLNNMADALNQMFTFHNCNILEIASPKVVEALHKEMVKFIKKSNSKDLQMAFNLFNPTIDSWMIDYPVPVVPTKDKTNGR